MKATLKTIFVGVLIGAAIAFPLGMNHGRERPLLSNPFAEVDVTRSVKVSAEHIIEDTRAAIHDATKPATRGPSTPGAKSTSAK